MQEIHVFIGILREGRTKKVGFWIGIILVCIILTIGTLCCQKQISWTPICCYISQHPVVCNYLFMPCITVMLLVPRSPYDKWCIIMATSGIPDLLMKIYIYDSLLFIPRYIYWHPGPETVNFTHSHVSLIVTDHLWTHAHLMNILQGRWLLYKNVQSSMFLINNSLLSFFDIRHDVCAKSLFVFTRSHHLVRW